MAVASVVGDTLAVSVDVVDARFMIHAACRTAPYFLARYRHTPASATVADVAAGRARAFFASPLLAAAAPPTASGVRRACA